MQARFPEGTFERIAIVLDDDEDRTEFVRAAVENELRRREASTQSKTNTDTRTQPSKTVRTNLGHKRKK